MSTGLQEIVQGKEIPNYIHPFTGLSSNDTRESIEQRVIELKNAGIRSMDLMWHDMSSGDMMSLSLFNTECYWERIKWVIEACRIHGMTFMLQDAAPFPTGQADGWFEKPEYSNLNKLYLAERHMDIKGPEENGAFLLEALIGALWGSSVNELFDGHLPVPGDKMIAVVACKRDGDHFESENAVDLTQMVSDGILYWSVPDGIWRIFVIYETRNGGGRKYYMNLLDADSVNLQIKAVHQPHYDHMKSELGKTWLGFFYDETEVGNLNGYCFDAKVGTPSSLTNDTACLPWSKEMEKLCEKVLGANYRCLLPLLWYMDKDVYHRVRYTYMDIISHLIQENYNGQVHRWCKERGILYVGHNLEDENSHARLSCGPVHYFRMQAHQDMAGIDLIGGQLMPGKDFTQAWYGCLDGDGAFYHYGLAKLASSAAHIEPSKEGRSFCELLAVYGDLAGTKLRRFVIDHLLVNGINNMIPADPFATGFDIEYTKYINDYMNRMCHLLNETKSIIKAAVLYHAQAEWYQGKYQYFHIPAGELAKNQISYDVVPSDIFEDREFYNTDTFQGLTVNGNRYEAFIIPESEALPKSVIDFISQAEKIGFPVFYVNTMPSVIAETGEIYVPSYGKCIDLLKLSEEVSKVIDADFRTVQYTPELRYNHFKDEQGEYYLLHNEGDAVLRNITLSMSMPVYKIDMEKLTVTELNAVSTKDKVTLDLEFAQFESILLYSGKISEQVSKSLHKKKEISMVGAWKVSLNGEHEFTLDTLKNINSKDMYPRFSGKAVYEQNIEWVELPDALDLGKVYEACKVYVNGNEAGIAVTAPYVFDIKKLAVKGENQIKIIVETNASHKKAEGRYALMSSMMANVFNTLEPGGMTGPVKAIYYEEVNR